MINEERVKELYQMAVFDEKKEKKCRQMGQYYMWDYVGKEVIKSFFTGTIAYLLILVLWCIGNLSNLTSFLKSSGLSGRLIQIGVLYALFMVVYLLLTVMIYCVRYVYGRKALRGYVTHLKKARRLYQQEEKR